MGEARVEARGAWVVRRALRGVLWAWGEVVRQGACPLRIWRRGLVRLESVFVVVKARRKKMWAVFLQIQPRVE